jgi:hypothetical protein
MRGAATQILSSLSHGEKRRVVTGSHHAVRYSERLVSCRTTARGTITTVHMMFDRVTLSARWIQRTGRPGMIERLRTVHDKVG